MVLLTGLLLFPLCGGAESSQGALRATLKNGLRVIIVKNDLAPVVTTEINYLVGSNESPEGFPGTAHAQQHMMFRGSSGLSADQLSDLVSAMGGRFNADTQQTVTQYFFTVPADDLDIALRIEAIRMSGVLDSQKLWEEERGAIEQEVAQDLSNPLYVFYSTLLSKVFAGTPYGHDALGTRPSFNKTTAAMLQSFHKEWYGPNNAVLVIAGSVDPEKALAQVKKIFGGIPARPAPPRPAVDLQPVKPDTITLETDLSYGMTVVAYRMPGYDSPDFAAAQIMADVLDSQRADLYALVPAGKALSADFNMTMLPASGLGYATAAFPKGEDGSKLVPVIRGIIGDYLKNGFPAELVEAAKRREIADAEFQMNSISELAGLWSQAVAVEGRHSPEDDIEAVRKVTVEDVNRVAKQYLVNDTTIVGILTPKASGRAVSSPGFGRKESLASKKVTGAPLPKWAARVAALPPVPEFGKKPSVAILPNGLRLIVQTEKISKTVSVYGRIRHNADLQTPAGKEGADLVLDSLFSYGTTTLDRLAFQKALDDIAADESAGTSFSVRALSDRFGRGVELMADNLLHPALPEEAFRVVQKEVAGGLAGRLQSPSYLAGIALRSALYPKGDPTLRQATPETVSKLSLEDVRSYYGKVFRPDMTTIVVIGDVSAEEAKTVIGKYFGDWKATGPKPLTDLPEVPENKPSTVSVPDASRVQSEVTLAETLGLKRKDPDYYTLQVGVHVLAGGFYSTRLYRDLREKTGLVYAVEAALEAGKTRSLFVVEYASDPGNVSKARAIVRRDLKEMQRKEVGAAELRRAKSLLIRQVPLSESSTDGVAGQLLDLALKDLPLDEPVRAAANYRKTSAQRLKAAFSKWIRPDDFAEVNLGPAVQE